MTVAGDRVRGPRRIAPNRAGRGVTGGYDRAPVSLREDSAESSITAGSSEEIMGETTTWAGKGSRRLNCEGWSARSLRWRLVL